MSAGVRLNACVCVCVFVCACTCLYVCLTRSIHGHARAPDLWTLNVSAVTGLWRQVPPYGTVPAARGYHAATTLCVTAHPNATSPPAYTPTSLRVCGAGNLVMVVRPRRRHVLG